MIQPNPNDPIHRDRYGLRARDGMSTGTIIAIVFAAIIVVGGIMWSLGSHRTSTANSPSMTTCRFQKLDSCVPVM